MVQTRVFLSIASQLIRERSRCSTHADATPVARSLGRALGPIPQTGTQSTGQLLSVIGYKSDAPRSSESALRLKQGSPYTFDVASEAKDSFTACQLNLPPPPPPHPNSPQPTLQVARRHSRPAGGQQSPRAEGAPWRRCRILTEELDRATGAVCGGPPAAGRLCRAVGPGRPGQPGQ